MESDFKGVINSTIGHKLKSMVSNTFSGFQYDPNNSANPEDDDSDCDEEEREQFARSEVKNLFNVVDTDKSGYIDAKEMTSLLSQLGRKFSEEEFYKGFEEVDSDKSGQIDFEEFYQWYKKSQKMP